ncbi:membrane protein [Alishewanella jeotgali]|uniref:Major coat protein n=1 Tax=Alishewanella jeotgali KCTC 22429 TaxID=1129374 RepID=H3Z9Z6_9ALTE|nr:membrane protein [Alishewanella jeotgali]EHR42671.1 major coat protein [Alishewanella jeotgali KCTC 22429]
MADIFAAVDMTAVATFVGAVGILIIGIAMAFKGISLGKRAVNKA